MTFESQAMWVRLFSALALVFVVLLSCPAIVSADGASAGSWDRRVDDLLPSGSVGRFTTPKGGAPPSWSDAVLNRIGAQNVPFRNRWPTSRPSPDGRL